MAVALFHKHLQTNQNIFERGIGKIGFFCVVLPIGIAYWPLLFQAASAAGSWAGPGPGPDRLGLKCYLAWGGARVVGWGERGNFMYLNHNFSFMTAEIILHVCIHTNFSIRVFWQGWDRTNIL